MVFKRENLSKLSQASTSTTLLWLAALQILEYHRIDYALTKTVYYGVCFISNDRYKSGLSFLRWNFTNKPKHVAGQQQSQGLIPWPYELGIIIKIYIYLPYSQRIRSTVPPPFVFPTVHQDQFKLQNPKLHRLRKDDKRNGGTTKFITIQDHFFSSVIDHLHGDTDVLTIQDHFFFFCSQFLTKTIQLSKPHTKKSSSEFC